MPKPEPPNQTALLKIALTLTEGEAASAPLLRMFRDVFGREPTAEEKSNLLKVLKEEAHRRKLRRPWFREDIRKDLDAKRSAKIEVRLTPVELAQLRSVAEKKRQSLSAFAREAILKGVAELLNDSLASGGQHKPKRR